MKKTKKQTPKFINEDERGLAAMYFTLSNVAMLDWIDRAHGNIQQAYYQADSDMQNDAGCSLREELRDTEKSIKAGDAYYFEEWEKVRSKYVQPEEV